MIMGDDLPLCFFIAVEAATCLEVTARQASPEGAFKPPKGFPMNEFSSPSTYADHLLKQHQGNRRASVKWVDSSVCLYYKVRDSDGNISDSVEVAYWPLYVSLTPFGVYKIRDFGEEMAEERFELGYPELRKESFSTLEEAKAAVQADFDRRRARENVADVSQTRTLR